MPDGSFVEIRNDYFALETKQVELQSTRLQYLSRCSLRLLLPNGFASVNEVSDNCYRALNSNACGAPTERQDASFCMSRADVGDVVRWWHSVLAIAEHVMVGMPSLIDRERTSNYCRGGRACECKRIDLMWSR